MTDTGPILSVNHLSISFPGVETFLAVSDLSFRLDAGKTLAIVGESGSGKSLTALALMGLLPKAATIGGAIQFRAEKPETGSARPSDRPLFEKIRGKDISMIFQEPMSSLNPVMKIGRQLKECILTHQRIRKDKARLIALEWLRKVQLGDAAKIYRRYPHQLSGGQKQRVMIAMAMCNRPRLLIADEPTTALDSTVQMEVIRLMKELQTETGTAMIFITHDLALAANISDEALVMYRGKAMEYGSADKVFRNPDSPYTQALIACRPSPEHKNQVLPVVEDFLTLSDTMPGTMYPPTTQSLLPETKTAATQPLLRVSNLRVWFPESKDWTGKPRNFFKAVDDVSFVLNKGEVLGLVGESGSGKSTLSRGLIGLLPAREGHVIFEDTDLAKLSAGQWRPMRRSIQMIFQDPYGSLNPRITIGDMLAEPLRVHQIIPRRELERETRRLLERVHISSAALRKYPHEFSGGQRQRLGIARALAPRPKLIICDESVSALDISVQAQILNLLKELQSEFELSYLFISHDLSVVHYISDRVMVMKAGEIVESGNASQVLKHPQHSYTQKLVAAMPH